jgi:uncharacterized protein YaaW (UPF0174 family)
MSQKLGHVYGVIPNPLIEEVPLDKKVYLRSVEEDILKVLLIGLGAGGVSIGIKEISKFLAEKEAKEIVRKKISDKLITKIAKQVAKMLGKQITKAQIARGASKVIPVIGGGVSAVVNYIAIGKAGDNFKKGLKKERKKVIKILKKEGRL